MKEYEVGTPTIEVAAHLKLYSFISSLLDDTFRLDFNHQELNNAASELKLHLVQLQTNLKLLSAIKQDYYNLSASETMSGHAQFVQQNIYSEKVGLGKNYQVEIMDTIAKIEEGHFMMSPSLSFRMDNILTVLKLLCGTNLA